ncbi:carboxypeptidase [Loigolactobacillus backii]|uniref:transglycosylase domain-containing protein n=1 Tax=Loigolactobacillus backii TaxID=375175 RepID=UPI000C1C9A88|nr:carboxypeptidase [Loigolactobacillus backii]
MKLKDHNSRSDRRTRSGNHTKGMRGFFSRLGHGIIEFLRFPKITFKENATPREAFFYYLNITISVLKSLFLHIASFLLIVGTLTVGIGLGYFASLLNKDTIPSYNTMKTAINSDYAPSNLYFAKNVKLGELQTNITSTPVSINQISPNLTKAITSTEDQYFYQHHGVVPKSVVRALFSSLTGIGTQTGGSTLTQQLVKMQLLNSETTFKRKASEILLALRVDKYFSKSEILQAYLNAATFGRNNKGQNVAGVQEVAEGLFGKPASDLNLSQAAFIAGLPQSPSVYTPYKNNGSLKKDLSLGLDRKNVVLFRMYRDNKITKQQWQTAEKYDLKKDFLSKQPNPEPTQKYGYVYNLVTKDARNILMKQLYKKDGLTATEVNQDNNLYQQYYQQASQLLTERGYHVYTTINKSVYDSMQNVVQEQGNTFGPTHEDTSTDPQTGKTIHVKEPAQNGSVLLNNHTGAVLGFVGGRDFSVTQINHAFDTKRSPGSSIKPLLVYGPAIQRKLIGSGTKIADFKVNYNGYKPTDYGQTIQNRFVSSRDALKYSYNIPAVNLYNQVRKHGSVKPYMEKMGIKLTSKDYKELGLALGGTQYGVSVADEASAYTTLSNSGKHTDAYVVSKITDNNGKTVYQHKPKTTQVFSPATAYVMSNMMRSVVTQGTASQIPGAATFNTSNLVGKTGTSNDNRDSWFVGSTPKVTLATWTGYDNFYGNSYNLTDTSGEVSNAYWTNLANAINTTDSSILGTTQRRTRPSGVTEVSVTKSTGRLPGRISYQGSRQAISGSKTKSLYAGWSPDPVKYRFAIGGSQKAYNAFWKNYFNGGDPDAALLGGEVIPSSSSTSINKRQNIGIGTTSE